MATISPQLVDLYERLSRPTAYQRFFTVLRRLPPDRYHFFANVDCVRRLALVAERETVAGWQLIGVGRYEPAEEPETAEVAFVVEARGIRRFRSYVQADNYRMLRLLATRTQVEDRKTEEGVTGLWFRRVPADATPR